jgi:hypothetical protein
MNSIFVYIIFNYFYVLDVILIIAYDFIIFNIFILIIYIIIIV